MKTFPTERVAIVDAHLHLYDSLANRYGVFERRDPGFEALVGDYGALPRTFLLDDYLRAIGSRTADGIIWHEFISEDPVKEAVWAQQVAAASRVPMALVGLIDFAAPDLAERLDIYGSLPNLTAVRQHLGWDGRNPLRRFASRPDLMADPHWLQGLGCLKGKDLRCGLEVFAPQLPDLLGVVRRYPDIGFTVAVMGWPLDLGPDGYERWRSVLRDISRCDNVCASISGVECIFGMGWTDEQVRPWIMSLVEMFGSRRCMLGSHLPIAALSQGFERLYAAYERVLGGYSDGERDDMFRRTARCWFRMSG